MALVFEVACRTGRSTLFATTINSLCISASIIIRNIGFIPTAGTPEDPEARWERDVQLMVEAGVNVVRMGEFAWGLYEPEEGQYRLRLDAPGHGPDGAGQTSRWCWARPRPRRPSGWRRNIRRSCPWTSRA